MERQRRTISRRFEVGDVVQLQVESRNGNIVIRHHDSPDVQIVARVEASAETADDAERYFQAIEEGMRADRNRVHIVAPAAERTGFLFFGRGLKVDYDVLTPFQTSIQIDSRNGRVEVSDVGGETRIESGNGSVLVERMAGTLQVECRNGRIDTSDCVSAQHLISRNGAINVTRPGGPTAAETRNGDVTVQDARAGLSMRSSNGMLRYRGAVSGDITCDVDGNGAIRIAVHPNSRFILDAEAVRGDVRSEFPVNEGAPFGEPRPTVHLRTVNGSIKIEALEAVP